jgi:hypothetical protein
MNSRAQKDIYGFRDKGPASVKQALIRHIERTIVCTPLRVVADSKQNMCVKGEQLSFDFGEADVTNKKTSP